MYAASLSGSIGLQLIQQASLSLVVHAPADAPQSVLAIATGSPGLLPPSGELLQARGKATESLFDLSKPDATAMKVWLMERLGSKFGLDMESFPSRESFGRAVRSAVESIKANGGMAAILKLEKELGLDQLGIRLDTLLNAILEPGGTADQALDAALRAHLGEGEDKGTGPRFWQDDIGLYGF